MDNNTFIGIGHNPNGPDLPVGLGMRLAQEPRAMNTFGQMSNHQKSTMIGYLQGTTSGIEARSRMNEVVVKLRDGQTQF